MYASPNIGELHLTLVIDATIAMKSEKSLPLKIIWKIDSRIDYTL
jgi:hypothetical protein